MHAHGLKTCVVSLKLLWMRRTAARTSSPVQPPPADGPPPQPAAQAKRQRRKRPTRRPRQRRRQEHESANEGSPCAAVARSAPPRESNSASYTPLCLCSVQRDSTSRATEGREQPSARHGETALKTEYIHLHARPNKHRPHVHSCTVVCRTRDLSSMCARLLITVQEVAGRGPRARRRDQPSRATCVRARVWPRVALSDERPRRARPGARGARRRTGTHAGRGARAALLRSVEVQEEQVMMHCCL